MEQWWPHITHKVHQSASVSECFVVTALVTYILVKVTQDILILPLVSVTMRDPMLLLQTLCQLGLHNRIERTVKFCSSVLAKQVVRAP